MDAMSKIKGCLLGAAIGDAMGAATEVRTRQQIIEKFGKPVREFLPPPDDTFARGSKAGQVTDDYSMIQCIVDEAIADGGRITDQGVDRALLKWSDDPRNIEQFAGPTTKAAILKIRGIQTESYYDFLACENGKASNGSGMKAAPAGLFYPGQVDQAIDAAIRICHPTHNNDLAISGACAVAAAISAAFDPEADLFHMVRAGLYGAREGRLRCGASADQLAGPSVEKRIRMAVRIALLADNLDQAMDDLSDYVGCGLHIAEAVPAAFGLMVAAQGDAMEAVIAGVNIGNDTDTVASICGGMVGAYRGAEGFDPALQAQLEEANGYDFDDTARKICRLTAGARM